MLELSAYKLGKQLGVLEKTNEDTLHNLVLEWKATKKKKNDKCVASWS